MIGQFVDEQAPLRHLTRLEAKSGHLGIGPRSYLHLLSHPLLAVDGDLELIETKGHEVGSGEAGEIDVHPQAVEQPAVKLDVRGGAINSGRRRTGCGLIRHGQEAPAKQK
ncbi:hypothetical protein D3C85_1306800 [compost metagenome]